LKIIIVLVVTVLLVSCRCDEPILIDLGPIPEKFLKQVPYEHGKTYQFKHSAGLIINFEASRETRDEYSGCERCCDFDYKYQVNETQLNPDYPVFAFHIQLNGMDTVHCQPSFRIGQSFFYPPWDSGAPSDLQPLDSVRLTGRWYYDVYALKNISDSWFSRDSITADSLYYNFSSGVLRVVMTNGEYYQKHE